MIVSISLAKVGQRQTPIAYPRYHQVTGVFTFALEKLIIADDFPVRKGVGKISRSVVGDYHKSQSYEPFCL